MIGGLYHDGCSQLARPKLCPSLFKTQVAPQTAQDHFSLLELCHLCFGLGSELRTVVGVRPEHQPQVPVVGLPVVPPADEGR
eukprot:SAG22_NODE_144_length_17700_cov_21.959207_2_plen_82_part_00